MSSSLRFHKDMSFRCGDIRKTILTFKSHQFSIYFAYFHNFSPPKSSSWKITQEYLNLLESYYQNVKVSGRK